MSLQLVPVNWATVKGFVADWHRHHKPPIGYLWAHGVADDETLVGVAIVGADRVTHLRRRNAASTMRGTTTERRRTMLKPYKSARRCPGCGERPVSVHGLCAECDREAQRMLEVDQQIPNRESCPTCDLLLSANGWCYDCLEAAWSAAS